MAKIAVLDYGASNLRSVVKALEYVTDSTRQVVVTADRRTILAADRVVFPGQGAIGQCMKHLRDNQLDEVIKACIKTKPFLGICLGLQSLMRMSSEDQGVAGLNCIPGQVVRFPANLRNDRGERGKIPHMGWNRVNQQVAHPLWDGIKDGSRFYFVHSYYVQPDTEEDIAAKTTHAIEFTSAIARDNVFATQFHPEKSQQTGLTLLRNFLSWDGVAL